MELLIMEFSAASQIQTFSSSLCSSRTFHAYFSFLLLTLFGTNLSSCPHYGEIRAVFILSAVTGVLSPGTVLKEIVVKIICST
jgi:hypothetical protein